MIVQRKQTLLVLIVSIAVSFVLFGNGIRADYAYDDTPGIAIREDLKDPRNIFKLFVSPYYFQQPEIGLYRPLPMFTYLLNNLLFGTTPVSFHIVNILLHAINSWLVFILIKYLTSDRKIALISFLLFLVHPIHTEAVSLIVGRAELLVFLFSLLMLYFHLNHRYRRTSFCFLMALFSKEIAVMTLPLLFYIQWVRENKFPNIKKYFYYIVPMGIYFVLRFITLGKYIFYARALDYIENPLPFVSIQERIFTAFKVLYLYVEKLIFPLELTNDYSYNVIKIIQNPFQSHESIIGILLFMLLVLAVIIPRSKNTPVALAAVFFLLPYLLISNFVLAVGTIMGERLIYFSSLGFILFITYILVKLSKKSEGWNESVWIIFVIILTLFSIRTVIRNEDWINNDKLYSSNLKNHPEGFLTQLYWGTALLGKNQIEEGKKHLFAAQQIYPNNSKLIITFGALAEIEHQDGLAEKYYKEAISKYDLAIEAYAKLGHLYFKQEKYELSAENLLKAISLYPTEVETSYYARTQIQLKTPDKGIEVIEKYFGKNPKDLELLTALGYSYYGKEDYKNALNYLTMAQSKGNINPEINSMIEVAKSMIKIQ
jgi:Tfp pilus assembly protein PilF